MREELESLSRKELQNLCKENGIKAGAASAMLIENLLDLNPSNPTPTKPEQVVIALASPKSNAKKGRSSIAKEFASNEPSLVSIVAPVNDESEVLAFELTVGAECDALINGKWVAATVARINKKTVRVNCTDGDSATVNTNDVRARSQASVESQEDAYAGLMPMEPYTANDSESEPAIDWLACCDEVEAAPPCDFAKGSRKSITASMHQTKPCWNSTVKLEKPNDRKSFAKIATPIAITRMSTVAVPIEIAPQAASTAPVVPDMRRKSFGQTAKDPTKTAPAIVPRLNKAAQLMMAARRKVMEEEKQDRVVSEKVTQSTVAPVTATSSSSSSALIQKKLSVLHRPGPPVIPKKVEQTALSQVGNSSFKARNMPNFSALHKTNALKPIPAGKVTVHSHSVPTAPLSASIQRENLANTNVQRAAEVSAKAVVQSKTTAVKMQEYVTSNKNKRNALTASRRGISAPAAPASVFESLHAPPLGIHGPFSGLLE